MGKTPLFYTVRGEPGKHLTLDEPDPGEALPEPLNDLDDAQTIELNASGKTDAIAPQPARQLPPVPDAGPEDRILHPIPPESDDAIIIRADRAAACFADGQSIPDVQAIETSGPDVQPPAATA